MNCRARGVCFAALVLILATISASWSAPVSPEEAVERRRRTRLIRHLKRLTRPSDWQIARKLYSKDKAAQKSALDNCPYSKVDWPWYLSSGQMDHYTFTVDLIPVNMDADPEDETLIVLQSDPGKVNYATFCLVDDEKRGRTPLSSFSEISHERPISFQLVDLTGDGASELIVYARDDRLGLLVDSARIVKAKSGSAFKVVWFGRLGGRAAWPEGGVPAERNGTDLRRASLRLRFDPLQDKHPAILIVRGERERTQRNARSRRSGRDGNPVVQRKAFEEYWRWDPKAFRFLRVWRRP